MIAVWWSVGGNSCYIGRGIDGLEFHRHGPMSKPGRWWVGITGWDARGHDAVIDDFGNLVQVR